MNEKGKVVTELSDENSFWFGHCYVIGATTYMTSIPNFMVNRNSCLIRSELSELLK
jgi:hypothetical protein